MIFIVESGSTKADWVLIDHQGHEVNRWSIMGFNPFFHSAEVVETELKKIPDLMAFAPRVQQVWFYGAGCSSSAKNSIISDGLGRVFPHAMLQVDHDLHAAAFATYQGIPQITCILGTGSNSVFFDGEAIREEVPALAYILGDEGSASFLGKRLLADYLYKQLPSDLMAAFVDTYHLSKEDIFCSVYNKPNANVYLASFSRFAGLFPDHPYIEALVREGFGKFLDIHVLCFEEAKAGAQVNFVGSVAKIFEPYLIDECAKRQLNYGRTQAKPVNALVAYHIEHLRVLEKLTA